MATTEIMATVLGLTVTLVLMMVGMSVMRRRQGKHLATFVRSGARLHLPYEPTSTTFDDVAGQQEAKEELAELTEFLKRPSKFYRLGARMPRGVLLVGPPGCGKTLLAKAVAGEAGRPFFATSGSEFMEMFAGVGASRIRDLFARARRLSPCIIFIDEIDAIGRHRSAGFGQGHSERDQTLNQLLVELDGFDEHSGIIVIAATNRPDVLDSALLRPGRFDRTVVIDLPSRSEREAILRAHTRNRPLAPSANLAMLASSTGGCSGAALAEIINEAAILAVRQGLTAIDQPQLNAAAERVLMGAERRSVRPSQAERRILAYHEAGHTLAARTLTPETAMQEISIVPHGAQLSAHLRTTSDASVLIGRTRLEAELTVVLAGRAAEELVLGECSSYGADDIAQASRIARSIVMRLGMGETLGPQMLLTTDHTTAQAPVARRLYSDTTIRTVDAEVASVIEAAYQRARSLLNQQRTGLEALALALLAEDTLTAERCEQVLAA